MTEQTTSMCPKCYETIPAKTLVKEGAVYLTKHCDKCDHGEEVMLGPDAQKYKELFGPETKEWMDKIDTCILNATDRCNMDCMHCYHMPDDTADENIQKIIDGAQTERPNYILMGAEPTVRKDLPELITKLTEAYGKPVGIYTNGIRLADKAYLRELQDAGLAFICFSLHTQKYINNDVIWAKKEKALTNIIASQVPLHHIAFSINGLEDTIDCLRLAHKYWGTCDHFRIRIPGVIGNCGTEPMYITDYLDHFRETLSELNWPEEHMEADNSPYHYNIDVAGKHFRIIRWPSVHEIDLSLLEGPPTAKFIEGTESNFVHQAIMQERLREDNMRDRFLGDVKR